MVIYIQARKSVLPVLNTQQLQCLILMVVVESEAAAVSSFSVHEPTIEDEPTILIPMVVKEEHASLRTIRTRVLLFPHDEAWHPGMAGNGHPQSSIRLPNIDSFYIEFLEVL